MNRKFLTLDAMKNMSIDDIIKLYREGYILEDTIQSIIPSTTPAKASVELQSLAYGTQCYGGPETAFNNTSPLLDTWAEVQKGRVWAQKFAANFRCLDSVQFNVRRSADVNFYIEIRKDDGSGKPLGIPLVNDTGLVHRTSSIPYTQLPTTWEWRVFTIATILPTDGNYWICFVPADFFDSPIYREFEYDRFGIKGGSDQPSIPSSPFFNGSWGISSSFAFAVYKNPTYVEQCLSMTNVTAIPSQPVVGESVGLSAQASPIGAYSVQFVDTSTGNVLGTDTATTPKVSYNILWTPAVARTYTIIARVTGQCQSGTPTTVIVTVACTPTISNVTAIPSTVIVNNPVSLTAMTSPAGVYTVEFFNSDNPTQVYATKTATTPTASYTVSWTPTATGTYRIKARVQGQPPECASMSPTTVMVNPATGTARFVVTTDGTPLSGVAISVGGVPKGVTGADGILNVPDLAMGISHNYLATKAGYIDGTGSFTLTTSPQTVNVAMSPSVATGTARFVVTTDGTPLSGVAISVGGTPRGVTDIDGILDVPDLSMGTSHNYLATKAGYIDGTGSFTLTTSPQTVNVAMSPVGATGTIRFIVTSEGSALSGVAISVNGVPRGTTNIDGILDVPDLTIGTGHSYITTKTGYNPAGRVVTLTSSFQTESVTMTPVAAGTGSVRFRVRCGNVPCEGASIWIGQTNRGSTLSDGTLILTNLPTGPLSYTVKKTGYNNATESVTVVEGIVVDTPIVTLTAAVQAGVGGALVIVAGAALVLAYFAMRKPTPPAERK